MPHLNVGNHHLHKRIRIHEEHEKYPHPDKWKRLLDKIMYPAALVGPFMMIPQILKIYSEQDASSIALSSWMLFVVSSVMWMIYGFVHGQKVIIMSNTAWLIGYVSVIIGALKY
ncbi:hypothetical protein JKY72_05650 [Candidatus Gracilibacteria bacterium]|nr:hypothetical protein [Candidatus Gracilibacteria bacterium]